MKNEEQNLLVHSFMNQLETDFNDQDYDAMSEMIQLLIKYATNKKIIIEYLSDTAKENLIEGRTNCRF